MFEEFSPKLTCHSGFTKRPPPQARRVADPAEFKKLIHGAYFNEPELVDFRQPGERMLVHRGAEQSLRFIANTPEFRVAELPGELGDDVKVALVNRLVASGFLVPVTGEKR